MLRLIVLFVLGYLCYQMGKKWLREHFPSGRAVDQGATDQIDDVMVKDPYCGVYFPKRDGLYLKYKGEEHYFCKQECRDKFIAQESDESSQSENQSS